MAALDPSVSDALCENCPARTRSSIWAAPLQWPIWKPLRWPARATLVLIGHLCLALLLISAIWLTEWSLKRLYGEHGHSLFGVVPLDWLFDAMDLGILVLFIGWGIVDAYRELKGD
jgi:hypothetical protein